MTTLTETRVAKKPYACNSCSAMIEPGEAYLRRSQRVEGAWQTVREHWLCPIPARPARVYRFAKSKPSFNWPAILSLALGLLLAVVLISFWWRG